MDDNTLRTIWQQKRGKYRTINISEPLSILMKHQLAKQVSNFSDISEAWQDTMPEDVLEHAVLKSFNRGILTVAVKSSAKRFQLQTFLSGQGLRLLRTRAKRAINKVKVIPGKGQHSTNHGVYNSY